MKNLQLALVTTLSVATLTFSSADAKTQTPNIGSNQITQQDAVKNENQAKLEQDAKKPLMFCKGFPLYQEKIGGGRSEEMNPATDLFTTPNRA